MKWSNISMDGLSGAKLVISLGIYNVLKRTVRTIGELEGKYYKSNEWCLELARGVSTNAKDWNLAIVEDAAYAKLEGELCC